MAGSFYPEDPAELRTTIEELLAGVRPETDNAPAYVVPHAGYRWSGPTAAHVYRRLAGRAAERVILLGPAHRVPLRGAAVPAESAWSTPLGTVTIDMEAAGELVGGGLAVADDVPHAPEHALEVQLPLLQVLGFSEVLPVAIGVAGAQEVAALLAKVAAPGSIVLCSTDLSHYLTQEQAEAADARTVDAIVRLDADGIGERAACGRYALRGLLAWARGLDLGVRVLHQATSGDEGGPRDRVVGYLAASLGA
ncbi:AmmeMemoRadiSam system protein B [Dactylosporangium matsuzakiense]|uniref:MEMO1 family protein n=1 Tax=Dactylosporangium matsuzakiense TaxID=53360 RepID=A0A9W6NNR1_9ACTN|nr:MEMO1 family protein [Dactylosporangium matsuzakiense]